MLGLWVFESFAMYVTDGQMDRQTRWTSRRRGRQTDKSNAYCPFPMVGSIIIYRFIAIISTETPLGATFYLHVSKALIKLVLSSNWHAMLRLTVFEIIRGQVAKIGIWEAKNGPLEPLSWSHIWWRIKISPSRTCLDNSFSILPKLTPIGVTVDKISVTAPKKHTPDLICDKMHTRVCQIKSVINATYNISIEKCCQYGGDTEKSTAVSIAVLRTLQY